MKADSTDTELLQAWSDAIQAWALRGEGATSSITGGGAVRALEREFSARHQDRPVVAVGSGTAALAACLLGLGIGSGDEVVTPVLDWPSAVEAIEWLGARPIFADINPATGTLDPIAVADRMTSRTTAVIATHVFGVPADVPALREVLPCHVPIVEDCAQAVGAGLNRQPCGTLGDAAAFSLGPGKHIDAGEGGLAVFARSEHWTDAVAATQHPVRAVMAGCSPTNHRRLSSRLHPFAAVLALASMGSLDERLREVRDRVARWQHVHESAVVVGSDERRLCSWTQIPVQNAVGAPTTPIHSHLHRDPTGHFLGAETFLAHTALLVETLHRPFEAFAGPVIPDKEECMP